MADRTYSLLRSRIERRLEKPNVLIHHMWLFAAYSVIIGTISVTFASMTNLSDIVYGTMNAWSVLVALHASYTYFRSGAWEKTREQIIQEEILVYANESELSSVEMVELHQNLSEDIQAQAGIFRKLAGIGVGYFLVWPGMAIMVYILYWMRITNGNPVGSLEDMVLTSTLGQLWQPLAFLGTFALSMFLIPWQRLFPASNSQSDLLKVYQGKGKRKTSDRLSKRGVDETGESLTGYDDDPQQHIRRSGIEPSIG